MPLAQKDMAIKAFSGDKKRKWLSFFHLLESPAVVKRGFLCAHDGNEPIVFLCFGEYSEDEV